MKTIIVVGNTRAEAEEWAKENVPDPFVAIGRDDEARLEGIRLLAVVYAPGVRSVTYRLYEHLNRLKAISGVSEDIFVEH